jgi:aminoglycoside 3-N-acetyltransferase
MPGDTLLIHSSYKSLGKIEGGAETFFNTVSSYLGEDGTLILPAFSYDTVTATNPYFNLKGTPSCIGYLPEFFRTNVTGVYRSLHATHSLCAKGKLALELTSGHELDTTPVGKNSPFAKLPAYGGKILMLGCGTRCNTSMHGVEETAEPPYCIDRQNPIEYILKTDAGSVTHVAYPHDFVTDDGKHYIQCYHRVPDLLNENEIRHGYVLEAECFLLDAKAVWREGHKKLKEDPMYFVDIP